ncbi:MAG: cation:proton antiporter subunit C [Faecalibacterium sp.]
MLERLSMLHVNHFETAAVLLFAIGMAGMLFNRNLIKKIVSMVFMDNAIYLFLTSTGYTENHIAPIVLDTSTTASATVYANPIPTALVLTGIVVSVSVTAFALALTQRLYKKYHTLNIDEIMMLAKRGED